MPDALQLAKIRQEIDYSFDAWKKIVTDKGFKKYLKKGWRHWSTELATERIWWNKPAISHLKMKSFIVSREITDKHSQDKTAVKEIIKNHGGHETHDHASWMKRWISLSSTQL